MSARNYLLVFAAALTCVLAFSPAGFGDWKLRHLRKKPSLDPAGIYGYFPTAWRPWPVAVEADCAVAPVAAPASEPPMPYAPEAAPVTARPATLPLAAEGGSAGEAGGRLPPVLPAQPAGAPGKR